MEARPVAPRLSGVGACQDLRRARRKSLLCFFLCTADDARGLSFWGDARSSSQLRFRPENLDRARTDLERRGLILYRPSLYQFVPPPVELGPPKERASRQSVRIDPPDGLPPSPIPSPRSSDSLGDLDSKSLRERECTHATWIEVLQRARDIESLFRDEVCGAGAPTRLLASRA